MAFHHPSKMDQLLLGGGLTYFTLPTDDSDTDLDREVELINMMSSYINRNRMPLQINGVYIFPQENNVHNLEWIEYQDQPCTDHCVIPHRTDKSFAKFYLTHSLCLKHRSNLTTSRTLDLLVKQGQYIDKNSQVPTNNPFHSKVKLHTQERSESQTLFSSKPFNRK